MSKFKTWPIAIAIIYSVFIMILVGFAIFSSFNTVNLVTNDYYRQELAYQQQIERIKRSKRLTQPLSWYYDRELESLTFQFPDSLRSDKIKGRFHFFRPSDSIQDRFEPIYTDSNNRQYFSTQDLSRGFWRIKIVWTYGVWEYYEEVAVYIQ